MENYNIMNKNKNKGSESEMDQEKKNVFIKCCK